MSEKATLRRAIREAAKLQAKDAWYAEDRMSCEVFLDSMHYRRAARIFAFIPFGCEVDITPILYDVLQNKTLAIPIAHPDSTLTFHPVTSLENLGVGEYGVAQPTAGVPVTPTAKDLMLVPALAYTKGGVRLGRGKGYYDRYLAAYPTTFTVGICRSFQLLEEIPHQGWDRPVETVLCAGVWY